MPPARREPKPEPPAKPEPHDAFPGLEADPEQDAINAAKLARLVAVTPTLDEHDVPPEPLPATDPFDVLTPNDPADDHKRMIGSVNELVHAAVRLKLAGELTGWPLHELRTARHVLDELIELAEGQDA
jgi:hypothetical protein